MDMFTQVVVCRCSHQASHKWSNNLPQHRPEDMAKCGHDGVHTYVPHMFTQMFTQLVNKCGFPPPEDVVEGGHGRVLDLQPRHLVNVGTRLRMQRWWARGCTLVKGGAHERFHTSVEALGRVQGQVRVLRLPGKKIAVCTANVLPCTAPSRRIPSTVIHLTSHLTCQCTALYCQRTAPYCPGWKELLFQ